MKMGLEELLARRDFMRSRRSNHDIVRQDICDLMMPWRDDIVTRRSPGQKRVTGMWDSTATLLAEQFSSFLKGSVLPSGSDFIRLELEGAEDDLGVRRILDNMALRTLRELSHSNFYTAASTFLLDFSVIGNGVMSTSRRPAKTTSQRGKWNGLLYEPIPPSRVWWLGGSGGDVDMIVREVEFTATDAFRFFEGEPGATVMGLLSSGRFMQTLNFYHFVYLNEDGIPGGMTAPSEKPWISQWVQDQGGAPELVRESGYERCPFTVSRWMLVDGDEYGCGRGHIARVDAKGLNELRRQILIATGRDLLPPLVVEKESLVDFDRSYDGIMVSKPSMREKPWHLMSGSNYVAADAIARLDRAQISAAFYGDALSESAAEPRSAEESRQRQIRAIQRMAAPSEVVDRQFLGPVISATIEILYENGQLPEMDELAKIAPGREIDVKFVSPFFTQQKAAPLQEVDNFLARRLQLYAGTQDKVWLRDVNPEGVTRLERRLRDLPAEVFLLEEDVEAQKEIEAQQAAMAQALEIRAALSGGSRPRAPVPAAAPAAQVGGELAPMEEAIGV